MTAPVRPQVAVLLSRFPLITETFILREVIEMERQGQPVRLVPLLEEHPQVVHPEARPWIARALYTPFLSPAIVAANLRALRRQPRRYTSLFVRLALGTASDPGFLIRTLALFPKGVYLAQRLEAEGIRHLHAHFATHATTVALIASTLAPLSFSFTVHAHDIFVRRLLLGDKIRRARFVRAISSFNRDYLAERYPDAASGKIEVIHVGVDPASFDRPSSGPNGAEPAPESCGGPVEAAGSGVPTVLCIAAFKPYKGIPVLLEACGRLLAEGVRFRCDVIGDGPLRGELERAIAGGGLQRVVRLLGARPQGEVAERIGGAAFVALSSVIAASGDTEGIPVVLMEAMAARRAVVAPALSGIPELVEDGVNGLLFEPGNARQLAETMRRLLAAPQLAAQLGEQGREKVVREFRLDRTVAALVARFDREAAPVSRDLRPAPAAKTAGAAGGAAR